MSSGRALELLSGERKGVIHRPCPLQRRLPIAFGRAFFKWSNMHGRRRQAYKANKHRRGEVWIAGAEGKGFGGGGQSWHSIESMTGASGDNFAADAPSSPSHQRAYSKGGGALLIGGIAPPEPVGVGNSRGRWLGLVLAHVTSCLPASLRHGEERRGAAMRDVALLPPDKLFAAPNNSGGVGVLLATSDGGTAARSNAPPWQ